MTVRFAYLYIRCLFGFNLLLVFLHIVLSFAVLLGNLRLYAEYGPVLCYLGFGFLIPVVFLAKEKNIWRNEFRTCPSWLKVAILTLILYGLALAVTPIASSHGTTTPGSDEPSGSAALLVFQPISFVIPYSLLWSGRVNDMDLINRVRNSSVALVVCVAFFAGWHFGLFSHTAK